MTATYTASDAVDLVLVALGGARDIRGARRRAADAVEALIGTGAYSQSDDERATALVNDLRLWGDL